MNTRTTAFPALRRLLAAGLALAAVGAGPAWAEPRTYTIDPDHFSIGFQVEHLGYADVIGMFLKGSGSFVYDEATRTLSSGRVVVAADSVFSNHKARDRHVRDSDFLDADRHPEIVFEATAFELLMENDGRLDGRLSGKLTLLGQTHPVTLEVSLNKAATYPFGHRKHTLGVSARTSLLRSQWGMSYGVDRGMVGDEVLLSFELEAMRD
ncbi:Protein YceI [Thauera sp. GDN1]|uniref:YceI family protein n=1 Tax=Thauera sp. GDN1 TaxID=2944810 RepID=UPI00247AD27A|nr:YceI family protein [Thauera sp. GDN1]WEN42244.1 Protein YceI [Thauera sp. GDN1]